jgi:uncharacterized cupredoxin-like copper-binding protein
MMNRFVIALLGILAFLPPPALALNDYFAKLQAQTDDKLDSVDWGNPTVIELELDDHTFSPDEIILPLNKPVVLRLKNIGKVKHDMVGGSFFQAVLIKTIMTGSGRINTPYVKAIVVSARQETEIWFLPVKTGEFSFYCSIQGHRDDGMEGKVTIR